VKYKVARLTQTCDGCPSQWSGTTDNGLSVYIRFRWGYLSAEVGNQTAYGKQISDGLDGFLSTDDMQKCLSKVLIF
jgi:hypothetical protein